MFIYGAPSCAFQARYEIKLCLKITIKLLSVEATVSLVAGDELKCPLALLRISKCIYKISIIK